MKPETTGGRGFTRRKKAFLLMLAVIGLIVALLYLQQVAIIYVLATLSLVILLLVVAFADLERVGLEEPESETPADIEASEIEQKKITAQNSVERKGDNRERQAA